MHLETRFLNTFRTVADCGSFTAAANSLGLTQSAVSQQVRALELELGTPLLVRSNRLIGLTPAGEIFLQCTRQVLEKLEQARALVAEYAGNGSGRLRIGAPASVCQILLPRIVSDFRGRFPKAELAVLAIADAAAPERLAARELDFALIHQPVEARNLETVEIGRDELMCVFPPAHALAGRERISADDLRNQAFILPPSAASEYAPWHNFMIEAGVFPRIAVETDNFALAKALVSDGAGITIGPRWALRDELARGELAAAGFGRRGLWREWCVAYVQPAHHTSAHRGFLKMCTQMLPRLLSATAAPGAPLDTATLSPLERHTPPSESAA
jgi:DNA-binding transcriptional LysR family regulator